MRDCTRTLSHCVLLISRSGILSTFMWSFRLSAQEIMQNALKQTRGNKDDNILANVNQNGAASQQKEDDITCNDEGIENHINQMHACQSEDETICFDC
mmetsp:Transcript_24584/g.34694  ORF Transcript_24584/g.34694 Transcript_24584/m.34694 type:complete len:98 (-) Transcript_24584:69-362(-)